MESMSESLAPGFLIALPHLQDANFRQSVVLLLRQDGDGAMGVVINQESPLLLKDLCQDHSIPYAGEEGKHVRCGGPVQPEQGLVLFGTEHDDPEGEHVVDGLHVSASRGTLARLCNLTRGRFQCYSGYAGWGPGQLEREIGEGSWLVTAADPRLVLETRPEEVWDHSLRAMGIDPASLVSGGGGEA
jgi:putative transcriptional regulator